MTVPPISRAVSTAFTKLGELPEVEMAMTVSPERMKLRSCSAKTTSNAASLPQAVMSGMLSVRAMARKRRLPGVIVSLLMSFIMCEDVAALPPSPMIQMLRSSRQACISASTAFCKSSRDSARTECSSSVR